MWNNKKTLLSQLVSEFFISWAMLAYSMAHKYQCTGNWNHILLTNNSSFSMSSSNRYKLQIHISMVFPIITSPIPTTDVKFPPHGRIDQSNAWGNYPGRPWGWYPVVSYPWTFRTQMIRTQARTFHTHFSISSYPTLWSIRTQ